MLCWMCSAVGIELDGLNFSGDRSDKNLDKSNFLKFFSAL